QPFARSLASFNGWATSGRMSDGEEHELSMAAENSVTKTIRVLIGPPNLRSASRCRRNLKAGRQVRGHGTRHANAAVDPGDIIPDCRLCLLYASGRMAL